MQQRKIIVIGAGMAGLVCARRLSDAGLEVHVIDKGRGIGGRLATRRTNEGLSFDHGAQYVTARDPGFQRALDAMVQCGFAGRWDIGHGSPRYVGTPGMNALAKFFAAGLTITTGTEVTSLHERRDGWNVQIGDDVLGCERLVLAIPAPQAARLLGADHPLHSQVDAVRLSPCLTLMAAIDSDKPDPFIAHRDPDDALSWIAKDASKPGRDNNCGWVAQASPEWSMQHLELDREEIAALMMAMLCQRIGVDTGAVSFASAHRWRYAAVTTPLGRAFARDAARSLYLGGDWCLEARVEAAWQSGMAIADDLLG